MGCFFRNEIGELLQPKLRTAFYLFATAGHIDAVYDVTVGYPGNFPESEKEFIMGNVPTEVHFHLKRYPIRELPKSEEGLRDWCCQRWAEKEKRLRQFYSDKIFMSQEVITSETRQEPKLLLILSLIYWSLVMAVSLYLVYLYTLPKLIFLAKFIFILVMERIGGFEKFQIDYYKRMCTNIKNIGKAS